MKQHHHASNTSQELLARRYAPALGPPAVSQAMCINEMKKQTQPPKYAGGGVSSAKVKVHGSQIKWFNLNATCESRCCWQSGNNYNIIDNKNSNNHNYFDSSGCIQNRVEAKWETKGQSSV